MGDALDTLFQGNMKEDFSSKKH